MELTGQNLIKYIEQISKLEASLYEQERSYSEAKAKLVYKEPSIRLPQSPEMPVIQEPKRLSPAYSGQMMIGAIVAIIIGVASSFGDSRGLGIFISLCGLVIFCCSLGLKSYERKDIERYKNEYAEYQRRVAYENELYQKRVKEYEKEAEKAHNEFEHQCDEARKAYNYAENALSQMTVPIDNTKAVLQQYYDLDIVFPKYRSLAAMCTICEYLQTARCTELAGPNGAYNLYESELRQNIIISKLDVVIEQLDQIKSNQYYLYTELQRVNQNIAQISATANELLISSKQIAAASVITAYCSEITAANTSALAVLATLK